MANRDDENRGWRRDEPESTRWRSEGRSFDDDVRDRAYGGSSDRELERRGTGDFARSLGGRSYGNAGDYGRSFRGGDYGEGGFGMGDNGRYLGPEDRDYGRTPSSGTEWSGRRDFDRGRELRGQSWGQGQTQWRGDWQDDNRWGRDDRGPVGRMGERMREWGRDLRGDVDRLRDRDRGDRFYRLGREDWEREDRRDFDRDRDWNRDRDFNRDRDDRHLARDDDRGLWDRMKEKLVGRPPRNYRRSDDRIREDICDKLLTSWIDADDVDVKVSAGVVTLTGSVPSRREKRGLEDLAERELGVVDVQNNVRVTREKLGFQVGDTERAGVATTGGGTANYQNSFGATTHAPPVPPTGVGAANGTSGASTGVGTTASSQSKTPTRS